MSLLSANLQAFKAIVKKGTVHGAAGELNITQTGVTQRIRAIEKELGTTLFLRSRKGMKLTSEGEALLRYCLGAEEIEGQVIDQISQAGKNKPINVTVVGPTSVIASRTIKQCAPLYKNWPNLQLHFVISDVVDRLDLVKSGKASLALVPPEFVPNEMDSKLIKSDKYILVGSPKWKGRKLKEVLQNERIVDFDINDPTTRNYLKKFKLSEYVKKERLFVNSNEAIAHLFSEGVGFGTLTQEVAEPLIRANKLIILNRGKVMEDPLALTWFPRPEMPDYFKDIVSTIK